MRSPRGEPQPLLERREPRVGAQRIEAGRPRVVEEGLALLLRSSEQLEGRVRFPERAEQPSLGDDRGRRRRARPQLPEERPRFVLAPRGRERPPQDADEMGAALRDGDGPLRTRGAFVGPAQTDQCRRRDPQGDQVVLLEGERVLAARQGLLEPPADEKPPSGE